MLHHPLIIPVDFISPTHCRLLVQLSARGPRRYTWRKIGVFEPRRRVAIIQQAVTSLRCAVGQLHSYLSKQAPRTWCYNEMGRAYTDVAPMTYYSVKCFIKYAHICIAENSGQHACPTCRSPVRYPSWLFVYSVQSPGKIRDWLCYYCWSFPMNVLT